MAKKISAPEARSAIVKAPPKKAVKPKAVEVESPSISSELEGVVEPSRMVVSYLTVDSRMDDKPITVHFSTKEQPGPLFEDIVDDSEEPGARNIDIPLDYLTSAMGFTLLVSYIGTSQGQAAASRVKEVGISFYPASESEELAPRLLHEKIVHNTPTYDMHDHTGDETVLVPVTPLAKKGDKVYCTAVTEQDAIPYTFYTVVYGHVLTEEEAVAGHVLKFFIARGWLARRKPWRSITLQSAWVTSGLPAEPPADVDPHLETRLPANALEIQHRRTAALIVAPGLDLPPPHLRQSVNYNDGWCLNPELTKEGGDVDVPGLATCAGDRVCFFVSGPGYAKKPLGCVAIEHDGDPASVKLSACIVACLFNKSMTLIYTLAFNESEQSSPAQDISVPVPQFTHPNIEEATNGTVDLNTFTGPALATVPVWAYAECSNLCWMWISGEHDDGSAYRYDILLDEPVTDDWKAKGVGVSVPRAELQKMADCSTFELHFATSFCEANGLQSAHEFPAQAFKIEQKPLDLSKPSVTEAVGDDLTVWNGRDGVHVEVDYVGISSQHTVTVCWMQPDGSCLPLAAQPGSDAGPVRFFMPREAVIESIGKTVKITYTVATACKVQTSPPLNLKISKPTRVPTPVVEQATPRATQYGILDLGTFAGNALITVEKWWFALKGSLVWLKCTGIKREGGSHTFYVINGRPLTDTEARDGLSETLNRSELQLLKHDSPLTVTCITSQNSNEFGNEAVVFPVLNLILKRALICQQERFESLPLGTFGVGSSIQTDLMKITFESGSGLAGIVNYGNDEYYSGKHFVMCENSDHQIPPQLHRFDFSRELESVRFSWAWKQRPATVTFYDRAGNVVQEQTYPDDWRGGFWVELVTSPGTAFAWMTVLVQDYSFIDNFSMCYRE